MTGCYPRRINMHESTTGQPVLMPTAKKGLNPDETTIAEVLKTQGYATGCIGKWHLGDQLEFLPTRQGFDYYFGIPYSDDMTDERGPNFPPLPLMRNEKVIEAPVDRNTLTQRYTEQTIEFIKDHKDEPFFVYLPHAMPGSTKKPFAGKDFRGKSANGSYGDSIEEIDFSTGQILEALKALDIDDRTLVIWTSDNGSADRKRGSNAPLSGWGYSTSEGGMRVPCVMRWPGKIPAAKTCDQLSSTMDLLPTFAALTGAKPTTDRIIDGKNIWPLMSGHSKDSPHDAFYYYQRANLEAVRSGKWKLFLPASKTNKKLWNTMSTDSVRLYDLDSDIAEKIDLAAKHPKIVDRLLKLAQKAREDIGDWDQPGKNQRPAGFAPNPEPQIL